MRRILLATMVVLPGMLIYAQGQPMPSAPPAQAAQKLEQVVGQLNLTAAQKLKLIPILKAEAPKVEAIKGNTSLSPMQKMEQLRAIHAETDPQVKAILSPDQYQTLQGIRRQEIQQAIRNRQKQ
jgi:hypothetical protein